MTKKTKTQKTNIIASNAQEEYKQKLHNYCKKTFLEEVVAKLLRESENFTQEFFIPSLKLGKVSFLRNIYKAFPKKFKSLVSENVIDKSIEILLIKDDNDGIDLLFELNPEYLKTRKNNKGQDLLNMAAYLGKSNIVKYLLEKGFAVDAIDNSNNTAFHQAAYRGHKDIIQILLKRWADQCKTLNKPSTALFNKQNKDGYTPLHLAVRAKQKEVAEILAPISDGTLPDKEGLIPLHYAVGLDDIGMTKKLKVHLEPKDINVKNPSGYAAIHYAGLHANNEIKKILKNAGGNVSLPNNNNETYESLSNRPNRKILSAKLKEIFLSKPQDITQKVKEAYASEPSLLQESIILYFSAILSDLVSNSLIRKIQDNIKDHLKTSKIKHNDFLNSYLDLLISVFLYSKPKTINLTTFCQAFSLNLTKLEPISMAKIYHDLAVFLSHTDDFNNVLFILSEGIEVCNNIELSEDVQKIKAKLLYNRSVLYLNQIDYTKTIVDIEEAIKYAPNNQEFLSVLLKVYFATENYTKILEILPSFKEKVFKEFITTIVDCRQGIKKYSEVTLPSINDISQNYQELCRIVELDIILKQQLESNNYEEALNILVKLLGKQVNQAVIMYDYLMICVISEKPELHKHALEYLNTLKTQNPSIYQKLSTNFDFKILLFVLYFLNDKIFEAISLLTTITKDTEYNKVPTEQKQSLADMCICVANHEGIKPDQAITWLKKAIDLSPEFYDNEQIKQEIRYLQEKLPNVIKDDFSISLSTRNTKNENNFETTAPSPKKQKIKTRKESLLDFSSEEIEEKVEEGAISQATKNKYFSLKKALEKLTNVVTQNSQLLKQDIKWILPDSLVIKETETTKILIGQDTYWVMLSPELEPEIPKAYYTKFKKAMEKGGAIRALGVSGIKILKNLFEIKLPDLDPRVVCSKVILDASGKNKLLIFDKYLKTHEKVIDYTHPLEFIPSNYGGEEFVELAGKNGALDINS